MELYTESQANKLIEFYATKMINKILDNSTHSVVDHLEKELHNENQYRVVAIGKMIRGNVILKKSIDGLAKDLNLPLPKDVLMQLNQ